MTMQGKLSCYSIVSKRNTLMLLSVDKKQKKLVAFSKKSGESSACSSQSHGLITPGDSMNAVIFWLAKVSVSNLSL